MSTVAIAAFLKPFFALIVFGCIVLPIKMLVDKYMKDGKLKRILFKKIN